VTGAAASLVFITGASSGIGQALAAAFYARGWRLALVARRGDAIERWITGQGLDSGRIGIYPADVRDTVGLVAAAQRCIAQQGLPDVVIANAGISIGVDTAEFNDLEVIRATFETNNLGMAATFHPFLTPMRERDSGTLVGIASVGGIRGLPGHGAYCASKAAVISYCESLRGECRGSGVRVVTLVPGYIATPLTQHNRYRMPFLMSADDFAAQACQAIIAGVSLKVIPWQMGWVARVLRVLPNRIFDRLFAGRARKRRSTETPGSGVTGS
jgi:short-subunit dehydrogenase